MPPLVAAAEANAEAVTTARNPGQQDQDRSDDADDRGQAKGHTDGPDKRREQDRDKYADHFGTPLLFLPGEQVLALLCCSLIPTSSSPTGWVVARNLALTAMELDAMRETRAMPRSIWTGA